MSESLDEHTRQQAWPIGPEPRRRSVCALVCLLSLGAVELGRTSAGAAQDDLSTRTRAFQLYDSLAARAVAESARDHMIALRWPEALVDLQRLLEEHRGEVLGATRPIAEGARNPSQGDVHLGASHWAERQLFGLPAAAQELYRERHEARAGEALARALALGDRGALSGVARRWPLTDASQRAWWALGDMEIERGETQDGLRAWARGTALVLGEPEHVLAGADDWRAAREQLRALAAAQEGPTHAGALVRVELALALLADDAAGDAAWSGIGAGASGVASFLDGAADTALIEPEGFGSEGWADEWRAPRSTNANPFSDERAYMRVFGARDAGAVYVNTSRAVHAIGAFSGETLWTFGSEELGWDKVSLEPERRFRSNAETTIAEFNKALDTTNHLVAPAVARGIVVAALQLPIAYEKRDQFNRIEIIDVIPERRLVGLDARTGERLWDGFPPAGWDGDSGTLTERMTVVGPPTIVGSRVLVPLARQRGRIEKHVGCFDLGSGALLWSTPLVTGQVPLNMFGRQVREFSAPPVVVAGGTVIVQTNLGVVAAVDLFTGDTLWETVYEQIPIQAPTYYEEGTLRAKWRNAPPIVVGTAVIATPVDCGDLIALDLTTGAMRWSVTHRGLLQLLQNSSVATEVLIGADTRRVYLFVDGRQVLAFGSPEGLERAAPSKIEWRSEYPDPAPRRVDFALPAMDARYIYLPGSAALTVLERELGRVVREIPGDLGTGNLLVSNGALVAVSAENVTAAFEWRGMVARAEAAVRAAPADPRPVAELARLFLVRADALADDGDVAEAGRLYGRAQATLTTGMAPGAGAGTGAEVGVESGAATPRPFREPLFRAHLGQARLAQRALDYASAELRLREALTVAPDDDRRREALLHLQGVQRRRAPRSGGGAEGVEDFTVTLERLAAEFATSEVVVQFQPALSWAPGGVGGVSPDPWQGSLVPEETRSTGGRRGSAARDQDDAPGATARTTIALWSALELAAEQLRRGADPALAARLFDLLRRFGDEPLPGGSGVDVRTWATGRLALLRATADPSVFAPYEAEARALLDAASADQGAGRDDAVGDAKALARIAELYPGTDAARRANDLRLDVAVTSGQVEEVARIVLDPMPVDSSIRSLDERQLRLLLRLAAALGAGGNLALRASLAEQMALVRPTLVVDLEPHRGLGIGALAALWREDVSSAPPRAPKPTTGVVTTDRIEGDFAFVGSAGEADGGELALFLSENGLIALRPGERTGYVWRLPLVSVELPLRAELTRVADGLVHVAVRDRLVCVRVSDGRGGWTWDAGEGRGIVGVVHSDGVALVRTAPEFADGSELIVALDAASGVELWRRATPPGTTPVAGSGRLVLVLDGSDRAEVIDLFLGGRIRTLEVGNRRNIKGGEGWITDGLYVLPQYLRDDDPARNHVEAFDLETGARAWRIDFNVHRGAPHVLMSVLEYAPPGAEPRRLFVLRRADAASSTRTVHVLNERLGALDRAALVELRERAELVALPRNGPVQLSAPVFFVETTPRDSGERASLRAVDVHLGTLWETALPRAAGQGNAAAPGVQSRLLTPVVGEDMIVFAAIRGAVNRAQGEASWELTFLDRRSGELRESRPLPREYARWQELVGVGSALFLAGIDRLDRFE